MGWRRVAEQELPRLAPETRQYLQAYADGVNAYIAQAESPEKMSLEYTFLQRRNPGYRVEPWTPVDSLAWLKAHRLGPARRLQRRADPRAALTPRHLAQADRAALSALPLRPPPADPLGAGLGARRGRRHGDRPGGLGRAGRSRRALRPAQHRRRPSRRRGDRRPRRRALHSRAGRRHRLELVGRLRTALDHGQAAARQRPAPRPLDPRHLVAGQPPVPRGHSGLPLPGVGLHLLGGAGGRRRPQRAHRVGHDQPAPRRHRLLPRAGLGRHLPARRPAGAPREAPGDPQGRGRRRRHDHRAQHRARPDHVRRLRIGRRGG